jgi:hypothetical protein
MERTQQGESSSAAADLGGMALKLRGMDSGEFRIESKVMMEKIHWSNVSARQLQLATVSPGEEGTERAEAARRDLRKGRKPPTYSSVNRAT